MKNNEVEPLWSVEDVATYLGVPVETVYSWRKKGVGPTGGRVGKHVRYEPTVVKEWFRKQSAA